MEDFIKSTRPGRVLLSPGRRANIDLRKAHLALATTPRHKASRPTELEAIATRGTVDV